MPLRMLPRHLGPKLPPVSVRWSVVVAWLLCAAMAALHAGPSDAQPATSSPPPTLTIPDSDPEMVAAHAAARASLARFWAVLDRPATGEGGFALKVAIALGGRDHEHIWTNDIKRDGDRISGVVNNVPQKTKAVTYGQRIDIAVGQISDWMYLRNGRIVGNYTLRPLLKRMPPADAERFRAMLAEP